MALGCPNAPVGNDLRSPRANPCASRQQPNTFSSASGHSVWIDALLHDPEDPAAFDSFPITLRCHYAQGGTADNRCGLGPRVALLVKRLLTYPPIFSSPPIRQIVSVFGHKPAPQLFAPLLTPTFVRTTSPLQKAPATASIHQSLSIDDVVIEPVAECHALHVWRILAFFYVPSITISDRLRSSRRGVIRCSPRGNKRPFHAAERFCCRPVRCIRIISGRVCHRQLECPYPGPIYAQMDTLEHGTLQRFALHSNPHKYKSHFKRLTTCCWALFKPGFAI
ncbi:hypothetical protein SCLCIDRAFT_32829 [Scleroderma citrinum Foug A]|uniref:Uncharacterized protein n=1 Tax=Scleroderma citrinum Foug A TaxID=1036808 RepID=A0A0C3CUI8_9AGAM|nr:hypothetical protein SCLCIDRAFT_32829 [Scleroderma citrinum Foug A]